MSVSILGSLSSNPISAATGTGDFSHTVPAGTELLLLAITVEGDGAILATPIWDEAVANEVFTLINDSGLQSAADVRVLTYGLINPTAKTATVKVRLSAAENPWWCAARNYAGVDTASVAAATNHLSDDVNLLGTSGQGVHASGGSAGNALVLIGAAQGQNMSPVSQSVGTTFTEIVDATTGPDNVVDFAIYWSELLNSAPSAITIDWAVADQNTTTFLELVAASAGGVINAKTLADNIQAFDGSPIQ